MGQSGWPGRCAVPAGPHGLHGCSVLAPPGGSAGGSGRSPGQPVQNEGVAAPTRSGPEGWPRRWVTRCRACCSAPGWRGSPSGLRSPRRSGPAGVWSAATSWSAASLPAGRAVGLPGTPAVPVPAWRGSLNQRRPRRWGAAAFAMIPPLQMWVMPAAPALPGWRSRSMWGSSTRAMPRHRWPMPCWSCVRCCWWPARPDRCAVGSGPGCVAVAQTSGGCGSGGVLSPGPASAAGQPRCCSCLSAAPARPPPPAPIARAPV